MKHSEKSIAVTKVSVIFTIQEMKRIERFLHDRRNDTAKTRYIRQLIEQDMAQDESIRAGKTQIDMDALGGSQEGAKA